MTNPATVVPPPAIAIFEDTAITLEAHVTSGKPKDANCVFTLSGQAKDRTETGPWTGRRASKGGVIPDKVADGDDDSYPLSYTAASDGQSMPGEKSWVVWRRKVNLEAVGADDKPTACEFLLTQGSKATTYKAPSGKAVASVPAPAPFTVDVKSPYRVVSWISAKGRLRKVKVEKGFVAQFAAPAVPTDGKPLKQFVNLTTASAAGSEGQDGKGLDLVVKVHSKDDKATAGEKVFFEVKFGKESARNAPLPAVTGAASVTESPKGTFKGHVVLADPGPSATFKLALTLPGGDTCTIKIGSTEQCGDEQLKIENWRQLEYAIYQPQSSGADKMTDFTVFKSATAAGFSSATTDYFEKILDPVFIKFTAKTEAYFEKTDLPASASHNVLDSNYLKLGAGKKALVLDMTQASTILSAKETAPASNLVTMIWVDFLVRRRVAWTQQFDVTGPGAMVPVVEVFEFDPTTGNFSISSLRWIAHQWLNAGTWENISTAPPAAQLGLQSITSEADIRAHIAFNDYNKFTLSLPSGAANFPGTYFAGGKFTVGGVEVKVAMGINGVGVERGINGAALEGNIWMNTFGGKVKPTGLAGVVLHELGHNMGQAYADKTIDPTFGRSAGNQLPGIPFPKGVPTGNTYGGHEHTGTHCAVGIADRTGPSFQTVEAWAQKKCIMFGGAEMLEEKKRFEFNFCDNCRKYVRAENIRDIRKDWKA